MTVKPYSITAKGLYGTEPVSDAWRFAVVAATTPTITSVRDSAGVEIPAGGTTFGTTVTLTGTAATGEGVEVFDGSTSLGIVSAPAGTWTLPLSSLALKAYAIKARGLYGSNPESAVRSFTVAAATAPTISSVRDSSGADIPNGSSTTDTRVTITGTALANEQVQLLDGSAVLTTVTATGGNWTYTLSTTVKGYNIKARGVYADNPESGVRAFTVNQAVPPLIIDTTPVTLNGGLYVAAGYGDLEPVTWPVNTSIMRSASGGRPPYSYSASSSNIINVKSTGFVGSRGNGAATVTVRDSAGQSVSYNVTVSGVVPCVGLGRSNYPTAVENASAAGKRVPNLAELQAIHGLYTGRWPMGNDYYYSSTSAGGFPASNYILNLVTGAGSTAHNGPVGGHANVIAI